MFEKMKEGKPEEIKLSNRKIGTGSDRFEGLSLNLFPEVGSILNIWFSFEPKAVQISVHVSTFLSLKKL